MMNLTSKAQRRRLKRVARLKRDLNKYEAMLKDEGLEPNKDPVFKELYRKLAYLRDQLPYTEYKKGFRPGDDS
jgi:hypothetical protein